LIETAVALAILALTLTVVYQSFGWTLRRSGEQQRRDLAWLTALSLLDQLRRDPALAAGRRDGRSSQGLQWEALVESYSFPADMTRGMFASIDGSTPLLEIRITVHWGDSPARSIELRSIELGAAR
jgi:type II secretory pathway pseudopilin PulG